REIRIGTQLLVQLAERARLDEIGAKPVVFGIGSVAPMDAIRLREAGNLLDPLEQLAIASGGASGDRGGLRVHLVLLRWRPGLPLRRRPALWKHRLSQKKGPARSFPHGGKRLAAELLHVEIYFGTLDGHGFPDLAVAVHVR